MKLDWALLLPIYVVSVSNYYLFIASYCLHFLGGHYFMRKYAITGLWGIRRRFGTLQRALASFCCNSV
ncbi:hypothetical protein BGX38DRAFT_1166566 [Terfezia claveryi]|nr:hypothetical protein BGX38DRAFT_1166566 [Terfezia claveryi]